MRSSQPSDHTEDRASRRFRRFYLRAFETSPFEDRLAAILLVGGGAFLFAAMWLIGRSGLGFDRQPELGASGWLFVALLLLATVVSARWATRRVVENGERAVCLWLRVRRIPDDGETSAAQKRPDEMPLWLLCVLAGAVGGVWSSVSPSGRYFDTSPVPWLIVMAFLVGTGVWSVWIHRRVLGCPADTWGIEYIRDGQAKAAASMTHLLAALSAWAAGVAGIPTTAGSDAPLVLFLFFVLFVVSIQLSVTRTRHLAKLQAAAVMEPERV